MIHFLFFICLFLVYYFFHFRYKPDRKKEIIAMAIVMFLFGALRGKSVGIDVSTYYDYYLECVNIPIDSFFHIDTIGRFYSKDTGFYLFLKLLTYISKDPQLMLIVISGVFAFSFAYFAIHQEGDSFVIFTAFITFRIFAFTLTGLRETMSLAFILIAICQLQKKKRIRASLLTIIAAFFHLSAVVFFLGIIFSFLKKYKLIASIMIVFVFANMISGNYIVYSLSQLFLNGRYAHYGEYALQQSFSLSTTFVLFTFFYVVVLFISKKMIQKDDTYYITLNIITLGIAFSILGMGIDNIFRIAYYFIIPLFSAFDISLKYVFKRDDLHIIKPLLCGLLVLQYVILGPGAGITEYVFFWE